MGVVENKLRKLQFSQNEILGITNFTCALSVPVKLKFIFSDCHKYRFAPLNIKITQFPVGFHLNNFGKLPNSLLKLPRGQQRGSILFQCWNPQIMDNACFNPVKFIKILQISFYNKLKKSTVLKCSLAPVHLSNCLSLNLITFWVNPNDTSSTVDADVKLNLSNSIYFYSLQ